MITDDSIQSMGGKARAEALNADQRAAIAKKAAAARWAIPKATHFGELEILGIKLPCYVLEDGRRVLSQRGLQSSIGLGTGGGTHGAHRMARFIERLELKGLNASELMARISNPILFLPPHGGRSGYGYEAQVLPEVCDFILTCKDNGLMSDEKYAKIVFACNSLVRALAKVGIIALVDEATGYEEVREKKALQKILEAFLLKEFAAWAKRFPDDFYKEMFRLRGWEWNKMSVARPSYVGKLTNDLVYERLAPGILNELKRRNPKNESGNRKHKHHQLFTDDIGHPALSQHLHATITLMKASSDWNTFHRMMDKALPKRIGQLPLLIDV
ncbi:MAG TPA: P63C domain-containing protein [Candidatus Saccharimonadales bacterium]|nr:P63C domain-containing protein [Candidatus Saccharimonadales bacterium]